MRWCCDVPRAPILPPRSQGRGRLWTVLESRRVGENCRASTLRSKFYFRLGDWEFLRTGKEEDSRSDNQEQEDIDGTGEVKH
jgi:hypothetical protein